MRTIFWFVIHALTLFTLDFEVTYTDGLHIKATGWITRLQKRLKGNNQEK